MTLMPLATPSVRRAVVVVLLVTASMPRPAAASAGQSSPPDPQAAALQEFQQRLNAYLKLREGLARTLEPLATTPDASELAARQESLAAALRTARKGATRGDLIPPLVAQLIARTVQDDFHMRSPALREAALAEVPNVPRPVINRTYPQDAALPTIPPLLLKRLPPLPDNLQYRFYARHVVILDGDTQIIVDYIPNVLPAH